MLLKIIWIYATTIFLLLIIKANLNYNYLFLTNKLTVKLKDADAELFACII